MRSGRGEPWCITAPPALSSLLIGPCYVLVLMSIAIALGLALFLQPNFSIRSALFLTAIALNLKNAFLILLSVSILLCM